MRTSLLLIITIVVLFISVPAQKLSKPTLLPENPTTEQEKQVVAGNVLHDAKRYDEALAIYDRLLVENPDLTVVMYEKSLTLYAKGDKTKAMETAYEGAKYKSEQLPLFYVMMASCLDDVGKPDAALSVYREAEAILRSDIGTQRFLSTVYYNIGLTYVRQKKYAEARAELKKAVENRPDYPSPHYLLSIVYNGTKYKVPAFLAAARFISLELNTPRSKAVAVIIRDILKPNAKDPKTGNITISLDFQAPTDEGEFGMYELLMGTLTTFKDEKDKNKTEDEMFVSAVGTVISLIAEDNKLSKTFVGKQYVPFVAELKKKGFSEVFGYTVLYLSGQQGAMKWLESHDAKLGEFAAWAKAYQVPK
ncbi:MAG: tetratricopeptide repeat protein [Acidobacteriota bacterium]